MFKKLAFIICGLAITSLANAQEQPNVIPFPSTMLCAEYSDGAGLEREYGEIPFLEGDANVMAREPGKMYQGKIRIFLDPDDYSYTILFDLEDQLSCMLTTGDRIRPIAQGDGI